MSDTVTQISSLRQFDDLLSQNLRVVADFTSGYCKPCGFIIPKYMQLAKQYKNVKFVVVDADKNRTLALRYSVTGLPAFLFFKDAKKVDECFGINEENLEARMKKLAG